MKSKNIDLNEQKNSHIGWWHNGEKENEAEAIMRYANIYFEASCDQLEKLLAQEAYSDDEVIPILYLASHSFELFLKAAYTFHQILLPNEISKNVKPIHCLKKLLKDVKAICSKQQVCDYLPDDTCIFIEKLDELNQKTSFRYPTDRQGNQAWERQLILPLQILQIELSVHGNDLRSLCMQLRDDYFKTP